MTQPQTKGTARLQPEEQETALLLSLAYLGQLTLTHLSRLLLCSERTLQRRLTQDADSLVKRGFVARIDRADFNDVLGIPSRGSSWWRLTEEGQRAIRTHAQYPLNVLGHDVQYPARLTNIRKGRERHDSLVAETIVCLVEAARDRIGGLSGVFARFEIKLNPFHSAPWADVMLILHADDKALHPIPWTRDFPTPSEQTQIYWIELDRGTEPLSTIRGKAHEYMTMWNDPRWCEQWQGQFGRMAPTLLWVVPDEQRRIHIQQTWQEVWPDGYWCSTTFTNLQTNDWHEFHAGVYHPIRLFQPLAKMFPPASTPAQVTVSAALLATLPPPPTIMQPVRQETEVTAPSVAEASLPVLVPAGYTLEISAHYLLPHDCCVPIDGERLQIITAHGEVRTETLQRGRATVHWSKPPQEPIRLRLPRVSLEVQIDSTNTKIDLVVPLPDEPQPILDSKALVDVTPVALIPWHTRLHHLLYRWSRICARSRTTMLAWINEEFLYTLGTRRWKPWCMTLLLIIVGLSSMWFFSLGQLICLGLWVVMALLRVLGWAGGVVWRCAWQSPQAPGKMILARLLLFLIVLGLVPAAGWRSYERWWYSWPCQVALEGAQVAVRQAPTIGAPLVVVAPTAHVRCYPQLVNDGVDTWRRLGVNGKEAWVVTWLLERR